MTLDDWQEALATAVTRHYDGWMDDFSGDEGNEEFRADVDQAFAAARAHWQLITNATQPDKTLKGLILKELNQGPIALSSAKVIDKDIYWNPSVEPYNVFRKRHVTVEPFVSNKPHSLDQMLLTLLVNSTYDVE